MKLNMPDEGRLIAAAKDWMEGKKPAAMCLELFVRLLQLSVLVMGMAPLLGIEIPEAGLPGPESAPAADPTEPIAK